MRFKLLATGLVAALAMSGCAKVTKDQGTKACYKELHLHFNNLNNEAQFRKDEMRKNDAKLGLITPTGSIYSTYLFDETAFIVKNYKCKTCETRLIITSPAAEYLCPSCRHCPYVKHEGTFNRKESPCKACLGPDGKPREPNADLVKREAFEAAGATVLPMFEFVQGKDNPNAPMLALVRYVRRQWAYDQRGVVEISPKAMDKAISTASVDPTFVPLATSGEGAAVGKAPGYHRLDATFVGQIEFEFRGGDLSVKTRWPEEAVRPWKNLKGNQ